MLEKPKISGWEAVNQMWRDAELLGAKPMTATEVVLAELIKERAARVAERRDVLIAKLEAELGEAYRAAGKWETVASEHRREIEALQAENKRLKEDNELLRIGMGAMVEAQQRTSFKLSRPDNSRGAKLSRAMDAMSAKHTMGLPACGDRY